MFDIVSSLLNFFYELVPDYAAAIALLTLAVMVVTTPLTMKGTRSMIEMQRVQPEMRRLQQKYKDDRQKLNEELMALYQEHGINPLGGCLPLLLQMPVFFILFNVIRGLTHKAVDGTFDPKYLSETDALWKALHGDTRMESLGFDLAKSAQTVLGESFVNALPYLALAALVGVMALYQQRQIQGRSATEIPGPQKMMARVFTAMFVVFAFLSPAALVVYFIVSTAWRIGQQAYITRTLYSGDDSPGAQAAKAMKELRAQKEAGGAPGLLPQLGRGDRGGTKPTGSAAKRSGGAGTGSAQPKPAGTSKGSGQQGSGQRPGSSHPRSRKKKKRR